MPLTDNPICATKVHHTFRHQAVRDAVLKPLDDLQVFDSPDRDRDDAVVASLVRVRELWQQRVLELRDEGTWRYVNPLRDIDVERTVQYLCNCPPINVVTQNFARACCQMLICPFCYGRRHVADAYGKMERYLYPSTEVEAQPRKDAGRLVAFLSRRRFSVPGAAYEPSTVRDVWCPKLKRLLKSIRRQEVDAARAHHGVVLARVAPGGEHIQLHRGGLLLTHEKVTREQLLLTETDFFMVYENPTKKSLADAVGKVMRYPVAMLRGDNVAMVAALLEGLRYGRFFCSFGKFPKRPRTS
jgi:hypothetical protein